MTSPTLAQTAFPSGFTSVKERFPLAMALTQCLIGSWIVAALAQISIPLGFTPVPLTGQTLGVLLVGSALGGRMALLSMSLYLVQGAVGLPFFAEGSSGLTVLQGATAGYLFGFPLAAWCVGQLAERGWDRKPVLTLTSFLMGHCVVFGTGLLWLSQSVPSSELLNMGLYPFVPGTFLKCLIAAGMLPATWAGLSRLKS